MSATTYLSVIELSKLKIEITWPVRHAIQRVIKQDQLGNLFHEVGNVMEEYPKKEENAQELPLPPPYGGIIDFTTTTLDQLKFITSMSEKTPPML